MAVTDLAEKLEREANRLLGVSMYAAERQVTAAGFFSITHYFLGASAAGLAAASGGTAFAGSTGVAGGLAIGAAALAGLVTALRPDERGQSHWSSAKDFHDLAVDLHMFIEFPEKRAGEDGYDDFDQLRQRYTDLEGKSEIVPVRLANKTAKRMGKYKYYYPPLSAAAFAEWERKRGFVSKDRTNAGSGGYGGGNPRPD
jgi:hypothetical protein